MVQAALSVFIGAGLGAWLRWGFSVALNPVVPKLPLGTLAANLVGGYLVGVAIAWFNARSSLAPEARLFVVTGFMGGLTTFSSFSAEIVTLLLRGEFGWALLGAGAHLFGSLALTALGIYSMRWFMA